jgi:glycosyltransferase involved in cell wall biosynthesis
MYESNRSLKVLHIVLSIGETSAPYNEHCLPWADKRDITICTYFASGVRPPRAITFFEGDGSLKGFFRVLKSALGEKEYDIIHAHSPHVGLLFLFAKLFAYGKLPASTVITVHDSYPNYKARNRLMLIPVFAGFERIVCCSRASLDSFPAVYKRLAGDRLCAIENGLDIARVDRIAGYSRPRTLRHSDFTIVAVSRLVDIKNPFSVIAAFQQSVDADSRLVYIGDGILRNSVIAETRKAGVENKIELTGLISREKVFEQLLGADLFVSASRGEGLPVSVLEAMACCCPVVLSDIPPHREIAQGVDFIPLIRSDDVSGFAREIKRFREMSVSERAKIGQECRKLVEERFSLSAMQAQYEQVYTQTTDNRAASLLDGVR